jgi:hypothetical protein
LPSDFGLNLSSDVGAAVGDDADDCVGVEESVGALLVGPLEGAWW